MTIQVYQFRLPLRRHLTLGGRSYDYREGLLLERDGNWAEASPLPAFSHETIADVLAALRGERPTPPSLAFALDCLETPISQCCVPMNCLLQGTTAQILEIAELLGGKSISTLKLKVGRGTVQDDIQIVRQVHKLLHSEQQLRLDANQAWEFEQAVEFLAGISDISIEYIEEPLKRSTECERLFEETRVPYALDETLAPTLAPTLAESSNTPITDRFPNVKALVCKPTILGGRCSLEKLVEAKRPIVFSAAFESGVGIGHIARLAQEFSPSVPAGLDTYSWLDADVLRNPPSLRDGHIYFGGELDVKRGGLQRIEL